MKKYLLICGLLGLSATAMAGEYQCKVYCPGGTTTVVNASSSSDAAKKIDPQPVAD